MAVKVGFIKIGLKYQTSIKVAVVLVNQEGGVD